jgi:hypothetical protein
MTEALTIAVVVFVLGFFVSHAYSFWESGSFPYFTEVHKRMHYWNQFSSAITLTIIISFLLFNIFAFLL